MRGADLAGTARVGRLKVAWTMVVAVLEIAIAEKVEQKVAWALEGRRWAGRKAPEETWVTPSRSFRFAGVFVSTPRSPTFAFLSFGCLPALDPREISA